jgi:predicted alpha/beta superfamily hydrolase
MDAIRATRSALTVWLVVFISTTVPLTVAAQSQTGGEPVVIGSKIQLHSRVLNETRTLLISKPAGYDDETERYPVLYLLDGEDNFVHTVGIVRFLAGSERIPPMLVVGIANTQRVRDLTPHTDVEIENRFHPGNGGADAFLEFIGSELIPYIDQTYRTRPYRVLAGHSLGGLFTLYALASNPKLFKGYIAVDPPLSWNNESVVSKAESWTKNTNEFRGDLYLTATGESTPMLAAIHRLCAALEKTQIRGFRWNFRQMTGETHNSILHQSLYSGLDRIFDGWHLTDPFELYEEGGLAAVHRHFSEGGKRYGYERRTPAFTVSLIVAGLLAKDRLEEAASVLLSDPKNYPPPWNQLDAMARAYERRGNKQEAIHFYKLSLQQNPKNENARKKLEELGVKSQ